MVNPRHRDRLGRMRSNLGPIAALAVALTAAAIAAPRAHAADASGPAAANSTPAAESPALVAAQIEADWERQEQLRGSGAIDAQAVKTAIARGRMLAAALKRQGVDVSAALQELDRWSAAATTAEGTAVGANSSDNTSVSSSANSSVVPSEQANGGVQADSEIRRRYFAVRWVVRRLALLNPLLSFDRLLLVKRKPPLFPHMSDQYYGWWARPGGGLFVLEGFKGDRPRLRCLTADFPEGSFMRPDICFQGRRVLFAFARHHAEVYSAIKVNKPALPEDVFYKIYELDLESGIARRLTHGRYDDFDARWLPNGEIVFLSTRKGCELQTGCQYAQRTTEADLPDSYVRCGGDDRRPVPVYTLHRMDAQGGRLRPISAFENFEWNPAVANDGRILYARWDYIDRPNGPLISLWSTAPDGANPQLVYGNFTVRPQCVLEARPVPGSRKIVFTAAAHHSNEGGSIVLLDRNRGSEFETPITRLTPEAPFPETEGWPKHYYANPWPLSEEFFLVSWSDKPLPPHRFVDDPRQNPPDSMGVYLLDAFGNLELLYRDPAISSMYPIPLAARPCPPVVADTADWDGLQQGRFLLQDVYRGMEPLPRGTVERLRIVAVPPKVQPHMNRPNLGVSAEDPGKFVLGTVPVAPDGSAHFTVPSGVPVFFQALDRRGMAVRTMRSITYVQPGQTLGCIGCHEDRDSAPPPGVPVQAAAAEPSRITVGPEGSWPLDYRRLVQPVLDAHCVRCHRAESDQPGAAALDLSPRASYDALLNYADKNLHKLAFERDYSAVGDCAARQSKLLALIAEGRHYEATLTDSDWERLITWMDVYAHRQGHYSDEQAEQIGALRRRWADLLEPAGPRPPSDRPD